MRKQFSIILPLLLLCQLSFGQEKDTLLKHQLSIDFGSYRNRYLYPITDIKYSSPVYKKINLKFSARLRSYGTLYFYSKSAYDFTPLAEYYFTKTIKSFHLSAGAGLDTRIRLVNDVRSEATSSAEPLFSLTMYGNYKKLSFNTALWTRFYSNGISFALLPELSYQIAKRFSFFARYEISYLTIYKASIYEWRQDCFVGTHILF